MVSFIFRLVNFRADWIAMYINSGRLFWRSPSNLYPELIVLSENDYTFFFFHKLEWSFILIKKKFLKIQTKGKVYFKMEKNYFFFVWSKYHL